MDSQILLSEKGKRILQLMNVSTMNDEERQAWIQLLPVMSQEEVDALEQTLTEEVHKITDAVLEVLAMRTV